MRIQEFSPSPSLLLHWARIAVSGKSALHDPGNLCLDLYDGSAVTVAQ